VVSGSTERDNLSFKKFSILALAAHDGFEPPPPLWATMSFLDFRNSDGLTLVWWMAYSGIRYRRFLERQKVRIAED
jgi:hypothetical protein